MSKAITIAVEGAGADSALAELFDIAGIEGKVRPADPEERTREGGVLVAIGAIVGIAGGVVSIVDKIIEWREKWRKAERAGRRFSAVIEDADGNRLALDGATPEQIAAVFRGLAS
jgi:hypothetical protein